VGDAGNVGEVTVFVEIPKGSRNKYEFDPEIGGIVLDRTLFTSMQYPADYGFIEGTLAEDGDPLDALVMITEPTFPGCRIHAHPIGVFHMWDDKGTDHKIICVASGDPMWSHVSEIEEIPGGLRNEMEHFFAVYKDLEGGGTRTGGFGTRDEAMKIVEEARENG
jgi:inorganic pyrophosphatase